MPATALILSTPLKNGADQFTISDISAGNGEYVHNILLEALEIFAHLSNHHHFDYLINNSSRGADVLWLQTSRNTSTFSNIGVNQFRI